MTLRLGLDIGGTKTEAFLVDSQDRLVGSVTRPTEVDDPAQLVSGTMATVDQMLIAAGRTRADLVGAGVGVPGQVDTTTGIVRLAVNLNLNSPFPLRDSLQENLGVPVVIENDVRTAALGAYHWANQQKPLRNLGYLSVGTGIAAGLILDGRLYRGSGGMAGEIGHIPMELSGPRCVCGSYGCLEVLAAGPAIAAHAAEAIPDRQSSLSTHEVLLLAAEGHPVAREVVRRAFGYLARAVYLLVMAYDVERVVIGGGVSRAGDAFEFPLREALASMRADSALVSSMMPDEKIIISPPDFNAGVMGAVYLAPVPKPEDRQEVYDKRHEG